MRHIKVFIPNAINSINNLDDDLIIKKSEEIIKKSAFDVKVLFYKDKKLGIKCDDSLIANEVYLNQEQLKDRINKFFNKKVVDKLIIKS
ncbi:MAG: DciA family protein [Patescibacteria group bacterium]